MRAAAPVLALGLALALAGCGSSSRIADAAEECSVTANLVDAEESIVFDTMGDEEYLGDSFEEVLCFLYEVEVPDRVISHMEMTRAMDGSQTDDWDGLIARWTYHPDSGLALLVYEDPEE